MQWQGLTTTNWFPFYAGFLFRIIILRLKMTWKHFWTVSDQHRNRRCNSIPSQVEKAESLHS